jgi:hypothetical protein
MRRVFFCAATAAGAALFAPGEEKKDTVKDTAPLAAGWIYDDLPAAVARAKAEGKPIFAVMRCPSAALCKGFDEKVAKLDPEIADIAKDFVCVRLIQMRGLDLGAFQFDWDLPWAALFLNADLTVYGRYGSGNRDPKAREKFYTLSSLKTALTRARDLHKAYPGNASSLKGKAGIATPEKTAEALPALADQFRQTALPANCIQCHDVQRGLRRETMAAKKPLADNQIYLYPLPPSFGLIVDPKDGVTVQDLHTNCLAEKGGIKKGDVLMTANGQPLCSLADLQWVLQNCGDDQPLKLEVTRGNARKAVTVGICGDWRKTADIEWRASTRDLRPGFTVVPATAEELKAAGVKDAALKITEVADGPAKQAGFAVGDFVTGFGGQKPPAEETAFLAVLRQKFLVGQKIKFTVVRGGKKTDVSLELP